MSCFICKFYYYYLFFSFSYFISLFVKCLPSISSFSTGSSYPPSTHVSGPPSHYAFSESRSESMSRHALSESHSRSRPDTPMDVSITSGSKRSIDENLLGRLKAAGLTINESLCYDTNPSVQVMYQRYTHIFEIQGQIADMVAENKWLKQFGKYPNKTEVIGLFVAKTTWHNSYAKVFPMVDGYEDMVAWLEGHADAKSDLDLWGVAKPKYTITGLGEWLKKQKGKKAVKSVAKSAKGVKEKEKKQGSGSGAGKGNQREVKQKEVDSEQVDNRKKSHKNKKVTAMGR